MAWCLIKHMDNATFTFTITHIYQLSKRKYTQENDIGPFGHP